MSTLEARLTERLARLDPGRREALCRAVEGAETAVALFHRQRAGEPPVPHPIALVPFVVSRRLLPGLARLADVVHRFQASAPAFYREDVAGFRALCPLPEATERWLGKFPRPEPPAALLIRPDVGLVGPDGSRARPVLFETNATGLAGLYNHAAGVAILKREVFPHLLAPAEHERLGDPPDLLALTYRWVLGMARRLGRRRLRGVAFVEEAGALDGYSELPRLVAAFRARGVPAEVGTPEELRLSDGTVRLRDLAADILYRDLAFEALGPPDGYGGGAAFANRLAAGAVVPGFAGEFAHKGLLEALVRPEFGRLFTPAERRLLAAAVPWTRVLTARLTEGPDGRRIDLPEYVRRRARRLLIKPNVGSSGDGILLGADVPAARWEARIARALRKPGAWVVQERRPATPRLMVYLRSGRARAGPCHFSLGLFYAPGDLGLHCRVSQAPVVNVARGGALACAFVGP
jgi:hypothetical protein